MVQKFAEIQIFVLKKLCRAAFHFLTCHLYILRRFFKEDGSPSEDLVDIETRHIIPVDLNSYLCKNARILSNYYKILDQDQKSQEYAKIFDNFVESIDQVLWNSTSNTWFDYNTKTKMQNPQFYPSNIAPLWAECFA